jgi:hypothetical protein
MVGEQQNQSRIHERGGSLVKIALTVDQLLIKAVWVSNVGSKREWHGHLVRPLEPSSRLNEAQDCGQAPEQSVAQTACANVPQ